jgi:uncharacterized protein
MNTRIVLAAILLPALSAGAQSPMADAVERKDGNAIHKLLRGDVNAPQPDGMTALHWAAHYDDFATAKHLVFFGADVKAANRYGVTPLYSACLNGNAELIDFLLEAGADPNTSLRGGETALMTAARTGNASAVKVLLAKGAKVDAKVDRGQTAVMWAAAEGHADVVETLIAAGTDFRTPLASGYTPLFFAVREGRPAAVRVLLKAGADVNGTMEPRQPTGKGPRPGTSPLLLAVENGHFELAVALLEAGADPNDQRSGFTALHALTWVRKPNRGDGDDGDPAPVGSGSLSSLDFVRKLVAGGADVNARLKNGKSGKAQLSRVGATPFLLAAVTDDTPYLQLLVELGADPSLANADGATPLMAAAGLGTMAPTEEAGTEEEALEAVQYILSRGADVNAVDKNGETATHGAAYKNLPKVVDLLAAKGAKVDVWNRPNKWGWTPLRIAEGYRVGNFKPSPPTLAALHRAMQAAGLTPPKNTPPPEAVKTEYAPEKKVR